MTVVVKAVATVFYIIPWLVARNKEKKSRLLAKEKNKEQPGGGNAAATG